MTQFLPPNLLALFAAREPVRYLPPPDKLTHEKKRIPYSGVADYLEHFENPEDTPPPTKVLTKQEKLERKRREKAEQNQYKLEQQMALWNPQDNAQATTDPYKTLFVARINYDTSESKLRREFEAYGKIKQIKMVHDVNTGKPRGYAFIEYESEADMRVAYKRADGKKIDNRRVLVDVERGRTIPGWKPRRLGGEKGGRKSHGADGSSNGGILDSRRAPSMEVDERRDRDRDRDRGDRGDRNRDRGHDRDRGDRDRNRERDRADRDRGDKDRGDKDRDRDRKDKDKDDKERKKRSRSRSKDKERRKRSKSKDRHRSRSKERSKKSRRSRSRERNISATQTANTAVTAN